MTTPGNPKTIDDRDKELSAPGELERMVLVGVDRDAFLGALLDPPEPTEKLVMALRRHRELFG